MYPLMTFEESRFAGSVGPDDADQLSGCYVKAQTVDRMNTSKVFGNVHHLQQRAVCGLDADGLGEMPAKTCSARPLPRVRVQVGPGIGLPRLSEGACGGR